MERPGTHMSHALSLLQVRLASRPALDAWYGAREWALQNPPGGPGWLSRQDYEEKGGEYLSEHCASNVFIPMTISRPTQRANEAAPASELGLPTESGPGAVTMETTPGSSAGDSLSDTKKESPNTHIHTHTVLTT